MQWLNALSHCWSKLRRSALSPFQPSTQSHCILSPFIIFSPLCLFLWLLLLPQKHLWPGPFNLATLHSGHNPSSCGRMSPLRRISSLFQKKRERGRESRKKQVSFTLWSTASVPTQLPFIYRLFFCAKLTRNLLSFKSSLLYCWVRILKTGCLVTLKCGEMGEKSQSLF